MENDCTGPSVLERSLTTPMTSMKDLRLVSIPPFPSNSQSINLPAFNFHANYQLSTMKTCRWPWWPVTSLEASPWCRGQPRGPRSPLTGWFVNITITQIILETFVSTLHSGELEGDGGHLHRRDQHGHFLLQAHPWYYRKFTSGGVEI